jgi:hypothetical protein
VKKKDESERLARLELLLEKNDRRGSRLCWIRWDPNSKYGYEIDDAREEVRWMVYEIKKLREENAELKSFVDNFREAMEDEFKK